MEVSKTLTPLLLAKINRLQQTGLDTLNLATLKRFDRYIAVVGGSSFGPVTEARRLSYFTTLGDLAIKMKKPFKEITKDELIEYFADTKTIKKFGKEQKQKEMAETSKELRRINVKRFFRWLYDPEEDEIYPHVVKWIKTGGNGHTDCKVKKHALSPEEVQELLNYAPTLQDQCLMAFVYETACRISEALSLKIGDIKTDKHGYYVKVKQTKNRNESTIRLINTAPFLTTHLNTHRKKNVVNSPLFIAANSDEPLSYITAKDALSRIAKNTNIKHHISWHCFRHGRLTQLASEGWGDRELMAISGHKSHKMIGEYVKIRDVRKKQLVEAGLIDEKGNTKDKSLEPIYCSVCQKQNPAGSKWCFCGRPLNAEAAKTVDDFKQHEEQHRQVMEHRIELLEKMLKRLEGKGNEEQAH